MGAKPGLVLFIDIVSLVNEPFDFISGIPPGGRHQL